jgi:dimethylamine monooxygenase subunit A
MSLAALFPDEDYRFHMRLQRGRPEDFFKATPEHGRLIAERRHWLQSDPESYTACLPECGPLLDETIELLHACRVFSDAEESPGAVKRSVSQRCVSFGEILEPDFLLLKAGEDGGFKLLGGCVCFPSSWSLAEKIGHPLEFIHGAVPGLNAEIGPSIQSFLAKLSPGIAWQRHNWGLSGSPELNQHPQRKLPRLEPSLRIHEVWLRVEHQALVALPRTGGILFGIRIAIHPLASVKADAVVAPRLLRALRTMPEEMAAYKNIATARGAIVEMLRQD